MTIDPTLPLELDDGTPCELVTHHKHGSFVVRHASSPTRPGALALEDAWNRADHRRTWHYYSSGVFGGGNAKDQFVLRNVVRTGPEPYEAWFR